MSSETKTCRRCSECPTNSHHWIDNPSFGDCEDDGDMGPSHLCKHCDAVGDQCELCGGDGIPFDEEGEQTTGHECCQDCNGEGVIAR